MLKGSGSDHGERGREEGREAGGVGGPQTSTPVDPQIGAGDEGSVTAALQARGGR